MPVVQITVSNDETPRPRLDTFVAAYDGGRVALILVLH